ncbi:uncharacterized protein [Rutidosis leptorrhynchoides]|uniref:uncharacterized protein n=1 Tax=Rutidosis leptorrhynchoides TaxID=125765 RepID=UPI003A990CD8
MEGHHPNYILNSPYFYKQKSTQELTHSIWSTTMQLEATRIKVQEELKAKDDQLNQLKNLLNDVINQRNDAKYKYQSLLLDNKQLLQQKYHHRRHNHHQTTAAPPYSGVSSIEDESITNCGVSSSDCEESIVSSPLIENPSHFPAPELWPYPVIPTKGFPEKGKFLETVMKAGPLLQNLLMAGPLPHWRHSPPPLDTYQIPSPSLVIQPPRVNNLFSSGEFNKKRRDFYEDCDSSTVIKYQRVKLS